MTAWFPREFSPDSPYIYAWPAPTTFPFKDRTLSREDVRACQWYDKGVVGRYKVPSSYLAKAPSGAVDMTFTDADLVCTDPFMYYKDCTFRRCSMFASAGMFLNCTWEGMRGEGRHAFSTWGTSGPLALIGCSFRGTDRGPVINTRTTVSNVLMDSITVTECSWVDNGNECLCIEGPGELLNSTFTNWRVYNSEGNATGFYTRIRGCKFSNWVIDRGDFLFVGSGITDNTFEQIELRNGRFYIPSGNTIVRCGTSGYKPTRGNNFFMNPGVYDAKPYTPPTYEVQ